MRKLIFTLSTLAIAVSANAQIDNGYYRVQNVNTSRYMALLDTKGYARASNGGLDYDLGAIRTLNDNSTNQILSNPATVIYFQKEGTGYICSAQGISTKDLTHYTFNLESQSNGSYRFSAEAANIARVVLSEAKYFNQDDEEQPDSGILMTSGSRTRDWYIKPVQSSSSDNYIGFAPSYKAGDNYYQTFYAGFPFSVVSPNTKVYYVCALWDHKAVIKPYENGAVIPSKTPVLVESPSSSAADNKIEPVTSSASAPSDNNMSGVFFRYTYYLHNHSNLTAYNPSTMRVLGVNAAGEPVFLKLQTSSTYYIPANTAYLTVPSDYPDEITLMSYTDYTTGIEEVKANKESDIKEVYTINGVKVENTNNLPHGIYIIGGKKVVK